MEDFRDEGESITQSIIEALQEVNSREDLQKISPKLKKLFDQLVDLSIAAQEFRAADHGLDQLELSDYNRTLSRRLRDEMKRIYEIEGCRELFEKCQENALNRLDGYEKRVKSKKKFIIRDKGT